MTRQSQKLREVQLAERLREALGGFPMGEIEAADEPDVLVTLGNHRTGIEVTELHRHPQPGIGPRRLQESERLRVVARARALAEASGVPPLDVAVHFDDSVRISKSDRDTVAGGLAALVSRNIPARDVAVVLDLWRDVGTPLPWIRTVRLYRADLMTKHHWAVPDSGWAQLDFVPELQHEMDEKNARHTAYRRHCDECWLLIFASGARPSGFFEPSDATRNHVYRSLFARTFFMEAFSGQLTELHTTAG